MWLRTLVSAILWFQIVHVALFSSNDHHSSDQSNQQQQQQQFGGNVLIGSVLALSSPSPSRPPSFLDNIVNSVIKNNPITAAVAEATAKTSKGPNAAEIKEQLNKIQSIIDESNNGVVTQSDQEEQLKELMKSINNLRYAEESYNGDDDDPRRLLSTTASISTAGADSCYWELFYTTEKEVNFFKTSWPFKNSLSSITQQIDSLYSPNDNEKGTINNSINFNNGSSYFAVTGTVEPVNVNDDISTLPYKVHRVRFEFTKATICWNERFKFDVPPVGVGWFDTLYCDDTYRLSTDSRGDYSVFVKRRQR